MSPLEQKLMKLPVDLQRELLDFLEYLLSKKMERKKKKPKLDWFGGLKSQRRKHTARSLQSEADKWRD